MLLVSLSGSTRCTCVSSEVIVQILTLFNTMSSKHNIQNFRPCSKILIKIAKRCCICYRASWTRSYFCDSSIFALIQANDCWRNMTYFLVPFLWLHYESIGKCFEINFSFNILEFFFFKSKALIHNFLYKTRIWKVKSNFLFFLCPFLLLLLEWFQEIHCMFFSLWGFVCIFGSFVGQPYHFSEIPIQKKSGDFWPWDIRQENMKIEEIHFLGSNISQYHDFKRNIISSDIMNK